MHRRFLLRRSRFPFTAQTMEIPKVTAATCEVGSSIFQFWL